MRKYFTIIVPLICVAVLAITFYMIFDIKGKVEEENYGTENIEVNEVEEDLIIDEQNIIDQNTVVEEENEIPEETNTVNNTIVKEEVSEEDRYSKTKLDEAITLVKDAWGEDDTVYFTNEGLNSEGLYIVAARDKTSTAVKNYFKVNLDNKNVKIDY